eukprot:5214690-Prymnesium_polylepis.1
MRISDTCRRRAAVSRACVCFKRSPMIICLYGARLARLARTPRLRWWMEALEPQLILRFSAPAHATHAQPT